MKNFEINYEYTGYNNELKSISIYDTVYEADQLTYEARELLTAMTYSDYNCSLEYFDGIAQMIGYETTLQGILDLTSLGALVASSSIYRLLVLNSYKNKTKGMWR